MGMLETKVAIVTGAGRGIGRGIATELAREGAKVAVTSMTLVNAENVARAIESDGGQALAIECNVNDKGAIDAMVQRTLDHWGAVNVLVNNAQGSMGTGQTASKPLEKMTGDDMYANFLGGPLATLWAMQAVFPYMKDHGGRIINTSSLNGQVGTRVHGALQRGERGSPSPYANRST